MDLDGLELVIDSLIRDYFSRKDYAAVAGRLSHDFTLIGTGDRELCREGEWEKYFAREQELREGKLTVGERWVHIVPVAENMALAMARLTVGSDLSAGYLAEQPVRFTALFRRGGDGWRLVHIHNSIPYLEQEDESFFSHDLARRNYELAESLARDMAADKVVRAGLTDPLTGILNLEGFVHEAESVLAEHTKERFVILKFAVNHFRYINRTCGYSTGDQVLQELAGTLRDICRGPELCARVEKDHFAALLEYPEKQAMDERVVTMKNRLLGGVQASLQSELTISGGIYVIPAHSEENVKNMLDKALLAQEVAARSGNGNCCSYYSAELDERQFYRLKLLENARTALERGEFKVYIQPQVDLKTGCVIGGEALTRWERPDGTTVMPQDFIHLFEQNNFIIPFDFYMLEQLCRHMRAWMDRGIVLTPVSINQSRLHVRDKRYLDDFCSIVDRYQIPHRYLAFELTESAFIECSEEMLGLAKQLHKRGFLLDIDDFGTGYASLNLLSLVAADILKIDRSLLVDFHENPRGRVVLRKVIEMARETEMTTICEGVETREQLEFLRELGCDIGQGYYFYRPMPAEQFEREVLNGAYQREGRGHRNEGAVSAY